MMTMFSRLIFVAITWLALSAAPARAEWREATTEHFVIVSAGLESDLIKMATRLEAVHWLLQRATRADTSQKSVPVKIFVVDSIQTVQRFRGVNSANIAGFYRTTEEGAIAVVPRDQGEFSMTILIHEYAHHFMTQYMRGGYPLWFSEGFAEVASTTAIDNHGKISFGSPAHHRGYELAKQAWIPLQYILFPENMERAVGDRSRYGQYWLTTHYLMFNRARAPELQAYLTRINQGEDQQAALSAFTGGVEQLDAETRAYLRRGRMGFLKLDLPPDAVRAPIIRSLRPGEVALIASELRTAQQVDHDERVELADEVGRVVTRFPEEPAALRLHARTLLEAERWQEALAVAQRLNALNSTEVRGRSYAAMAMLRIAHDRGEVDDDTAKRARALIVQANRLDPDDHVALVAYYESFILAGERPPSIAVEGLYKASQLVPQFESLRMNVALRLLEDGDVPTARSLLSPIALSPHSSDAQAYALQLLQWIDAGATGNPPIFVAPVSL